MKARKHGMDEREKELVKLLMAKYKSMGDSCETEKICRNDYGKKTISSNYGDCEIFLCK